MLSNEQRIEVAEKIWRWKITIEQNQEPWWRDSNRTLQFPVNRLGLRNELDSWSGFGRTVEAMFEKDWLFGKEFIIENKGHELAFRFNSSCKVFPVIWDGYEPEELIEATHLAALEAVRGKG